MCLFLTIICISMVELITADYPDVRIVGSVHSNTTLTCDRNFNNYPEWYGANGIQITYLNGMEINPSYSRLMWASNKRDLIIRDTQKSDAGNYTCSVPDSVIYIIAFEVRVSPDPPEIQNKDGSIVRGIEDQSVTLTCVSKGGYPAPYLNWYSENTKLSSRRTEAVQADGTTTVTITSSFTATKNLDKTIYTCQSSFDLPDTPLITPVMLYLSLKPSIPVITGTTTITENNNVQLQCGSTGCRPEGNMSWSFDGSTTSQNVQNTPVSDKYRISSSFTSRTLYKTDNGKIVTCIVGHVSLASPLTTSLNLNVQFAPTSIHLTGNQQIVANGQNKLTLMCTTDSAYPTATVTWWNGSSQITVGTSQTTSSGYYGGTTTVGKLEIKPTRTMDGDSISCQGSNSQGPTNPPVDQVALDLIYGPIVTIQEGTSITYNDGDRNKILNCTASSKPASVFTWFLDNNQVKNSSSPVSTNQFDYTIGTVRRTHYGVYRCEADNSVESTGHDSITVRVRFAPTSISLSGNQQIIANGQNKLTLTCTTDSAYPTATVTWWNGSSQITVGTSQTTSSGYYGGTTTVGKLEIRPTRTMDGDSISCQGSNTQGPSNPPEDQVALNLKYGPIVTIQEGTSITYNDGDRNKILNCTASSKPASVFTWFHDNNQVKTSTTPVSANQFQYNFNTVSRNHYGVYKCKADNSIESAGQDAITVNVRFAPTSIHLTGNQQIVANGQNKLTLTCTTDSAYPTATVTWWNGSSQITVGTSQTTPPGHYGGTTTVGKLEIKPTRTMDGTSISCQGSNSQGPTNPQKDQVTLNLKYNPITTIIGGSQKNATEGDTDLPLDCTAESKPPAKFTWQKTGDSSPIKTGTGTADNNRLVYTIPTVSRYHAGSYRCTADNEIPSPDSAEQELVVFYPPDITVSTTNTTINATEHYINCSADGFPSSYVFTTWTQKWPYTGEIIRDNLKSSSLTSSSTQSLHFPSLTYQDTGVYACGAGNGVKNIVSVGSVFLLVKSSPVVTFFSNERHTEDLVHKVPASLNKRFAIHLKVYSNVGDIVTKVYKFSNNTLISVNGTSVNSVKTTGKLSMHSHLVDTDDAYELSINHTIKSQEEFGEFVLYLTNEIGTTTQKFEISPQGPPCTPFDFSVNGPGSDTITVSWVRCFHNGFPQTFVVQYSTDGSKWTNGSFVDGGMSISKERLNTSIDGLETNTLYYLKLYSFNEKGTSNETAVIDVKTTQSGDSEEQTSIGPIAGGAVGGIVVAVIIIVVVLFIVRRRRGAPGSPKSKLLDENGRTVESGKNDDSPAGPPPSSSNEIPIYSEVKKPPKNTEKDIYAEVKKPKSKGISADKKKENVAETPMKTQKGKQKQKKDKKTKANKKTTQDTNNDGMVYENANELGTGAKDGDNVYENRSFSIDDEKPSRTKNDDGLIYIEVELPKKNGKDERKFVIRGIEDTTDYADIVIGKVGPPAPESDEEETKEKTTD